MGDFPMFKLATQLARQLSSPIATTIKEYARSHPGLSRRVCMTVARQFKTTELRVRLRLAAVAASSHRHTARSLSDQEAINIGADLIGEVILFVLGSGIIIFEVNRQAQIKEAKKMDRRSRWVALMLSLEELVTELALQQQELDSMQGTLHQLVEKRREEAAREAERMKTEQQKK